MGKDWGFNVGVLFIIGFLHVTVNVFVLIPWLQFSAICWFILITINFGAVMIYINYIKCWKSEPGFVPPDYVFVFLSLIFIYSIKLFNIQIRNQVILGKLK